MTNYMRLPSLAALFMLLVPYAHTADQPAYQPCPLLRAYSMPPIINMSSAAMQSLVAEFTSIFDDLVQTGHSDEFGDITPNTTSFSVLMFSGAEELAASPIMFEYQHTAAAALALNNTNIVTADTVFPVGSLTQLFTVYMWLVKMGDRHWEAPITDFLPELASAASPDNFTVAWGEVTVGALASHMAGIARDSSACQLGSPCSRQEFVNRFASKPAVFLPDTTPLFSNAAFQLIALALTNRSGSGTDGQDFSDILSNEILQPLNMSRSGVLNTTGEGPAYTFGGGINSSATGDPAALAMLSSTRDLATAGHAMLSSRLLPLHITRRWLQPTADTSNLRNGVGRPWEIYHAGSTAISPIVDVFTKTGSIGRYSSYFGLAPDFNAGFAILAHDTARDGPDLNVLADIVSGALETLQSVAMTQMALTYAGKYGDGAGGTAVFSVSAEPGLLVETMVLNGTDLRAKAAADAGIALANLDFRLYPTNVASEGQLQFVTVLQDTSAPVDAGTPTCITWMTTDALGTSGVGRVVFELGTAGVVSAVQVPGWGVLQQETQ